MKKLIALCVSMLMICCTLLSLSSCSKDDGVPDGMRLVAGGDSLGYYFYGPEEWIVANTGNIASTYVSKIQTTSITFAPAKAPEGEPSKELLTEYFNSYKDNYPAPITVTSEMEKCTFGNASDAYKISFRYTYDQKDIGHMQIFVFNGDDFYIFTYTSYNTARTEDDGQTHYQFYMDKVTSVIDNFKFTDKTPSGDASEPKYEKDDDGYLLVSDKTLSGFKLYVPDIYSVDFSSGMVSVSDSEGRNINVSRATYSLVGFMDYWSKRKAELELIVDTVTDNEGNTVSTLEYSEEDLLVEVRHSSANSAASFEYTYFMNGIKYRVYQVILADSFNAFVFTYTAQDGAYAAGIEQAQTILGKMEF